MALLTTCRWPALSTTSQAQPLPKRLRAAWVKACLKASSPPRSRSIAAANSPPGSPPPRGLITCQNRLWLAWPPP
ncbi:hypothetical protein D3C76_1800930 [compost metagenome]